MSGAAPFLSVKDFKKIISESSCPILCSFAARSGRLDSGSTVSCVENPANSTDNAEREESSDAAFNFEVAPHIAGI